MKIEDVEKIGVLGFGLMGGGIGQVCATFGYKVVGLDISEDVLKKSVKNIIGGRYGLKRGLDRGKLTKEQFDFAVNNIKTTTKMEDLAETDVIIEAAPEILPLKIKLFKELDELCPEKTILTSNTSGFSITAMAVATDRADRFVGMHWFNPAPVMRLVEVIKTEFTSDEAADCVKDLSVKVGKTPIVIKDSLRAYGFVANRAYGALSRECRAIVQEGIATMEQVNTALKLGYGLPMGPFEMGGLVGRRGVPQRQAS